jgi:hypothetical protein
MKRKSSPGKYWAEAEVMPPAMIARVVSGRDIWNRQGSDSVRMISRGIQEILILDFIRGEQ